MNFEGFKDLIQRVAGQWWQLATREIVEMDSGEIQINKVTGPLLVIVSN